MTGARYEPPRLDHQRASELRYKARKRDERVLARVAAEKNAGSLT